MKTEDIINDAFDSIPVDSVIFINKLSDLTERLQFILDEKGWTQRDLALAMGKNESEISKWFTTIHNFTLKSIAKLEATLGAELFCIPLPDHSHGQHNHNSQLYLEKK